MTGEESTDFFLRTAFTLSIHKQLSRMLFKNQRTCSTVGKKNPRQLEGYDLEVNVNPILSMEQQELHYF